MAHTLTLIYVLICVVISISLMHAAQPSTRYIRERHSPWAAPIDVCFQNLFTPRTPRSTKYTCQEVCDGVGENRQCARQVVQHRFNSADCSGAITEQNFFECPQYGDFICQCYEEAEYNGEVVSDGDYEPSYVIANLTRGYVPPPSDVEVVLNETLIEPEECVRDEVFPFYRGFAAITNSCFFVNRTAIDQTWGWFRVRCDNDSVALDYFDKEDCNGTQHDGFPLVQHNGCRRRPFYGQVWWSDVVECSVPVLVTSGGDPLCTRVSIIFVFIIAGVWTV